MVWSPSLSYRVRRFFRMVGGYEPVVEKEKEKEKRYWSRWTTLQASLLISSFASISYSFGLFSDELRTNLGFSQLKIDVISSFGEMGLWSTFLIGLLAEFIPPGALFVLAAALSSGGIAYIGFIGGGDASSAASSCAAIATAFYFANVGCSTFGLISQSLAVKNFPLADRGKVSGLTKSMVGLSSAVLSALYSGFFSSQHPFAFLMFLSLLLGGLGLLCATLMNAVPPLHSVSYEIELKQGISPKFSPILGWYFALLALVIAFASLEATGTPVPAPYAGSIVMAAIILSMALPVLNGMCRITPSAGYSSLDDHAAPLLGDDIHISGPEAATAAPSDGVNWRGCLQDNRFWLVWVAFMSGTGSGLIVINNLPQMRESLGLDSSPTVVALLGISSAIGRLVAGNVSDWVVARGLPRAALLSSCLAISSILSLVMSFGHARILNYCMIGVGFIYGTIFSLVLAITADYFGTRHIAVTYGLLDTAPAAASFFATFLVSLSYGSGVCMGATCFGPSFIVLGIMTLASSLMTAEFLVRRQRHLPPCQ